MDRLLVRLVLMNKGHVEHDFKRDMVKPILGEIVTIAGDPVQSDYEIKFIQYYFSEKAEYKYLLVTGIKK
jgi:hypothetical protein